MSVAWNCEDKEYFRKLGIDVDEEPKKMPTSGYLVMSAWLFLAVLCGAAWYGVVLALAWALRHLGVVITGI